MASGESRADYFKERRKTIGQFSVAIEKRKLEAFSEVLKAQGKTKTGWLNEKIDEELAKK